MDRKRSSESVVELAPRFTIEARDDSRIHSTMDGHGPLRRDASRPLLTPHLSQLQGVAATLSMKSSVTGMVPEAAARGGWVLPDDALSRALSVPPELRALAKVIHDVDYLQFPELMAPPGKNPPPHAVAAITTEIRGTPLTASEMELLNITYNEYRQHLRGVDVTTVFQVQVAETLRWTTSIDSACGAAGISLADVFVTVPQVHNFFLTLTQTQFSAMQGSAPALVADATNNVLRTIVKRIEEHSAQRQLLTEQLANLKRRRRLFQEETQQEKSPMRLGRQSSRRRAKRVEDLDSRCSSPLGNSLSVPLTVGVTVPSIQTQMSWWLRRGDVGGRPNAQPLATETSQHSLLSADSAPPAAVFRSHSGRKRMVALEESVQLFDSDESKRSLCRSEAETVTVDCGSSSDADDNMAAWLITEDARLREEEREMIDRHALVYASLDGALGEYLEQLRWFADVFAYGGTFNVKAHLDDHVACELWIKYAGQSAVGCPTSQFLPALQMFPQWCWQILLSLLDYGQCGVISVFSLKKVLEVWGPFMLLSQNLSEESGVYVMHSSRAELTAVFSKVKTSLEPGDYAATISPRLGEVDVVLMTRVGAIHSMTAKRRNGSWTLHGVSLLDFETITDAFLTLGDIFKRPCGQVMGPEGYFPDDGADASFSHCDRASHVLQLISATIVAARSNPRCTRGSRRALRRGEGAKREFISSIGGVLIGGERQGIANPNESPTYSKLHRACFRNNRRYVAALIERGGSTMVNSALTIPSIAKDFCWSPLLCAVNNPNGDPVEIVTLLVQTGADVEYRDDAGCTALYYAIANGYAGAVRVLLAKCPTLKAAEGTLPLFLALGVSRFLSRQRDVERLMNTIPSVKVLEAILQLSKPFTCKVDAESDDTPRADFKGVLEKLQHASHLVRLAFVILRSKQNNVDLKPDDILRGNGELAVALQQVSPSKGGVTSSLTRAPPSPSGICVGNWSARSDMDPASMYTTTPAECLRSWLLTVNEGCGIIPAAVWENNFEKELLTPEMQQLATERTSYNTWLCSQQPERIAQCLRVLSDYCFFFSCQVHVASLRQAREAEQLKSRAAAP